METNYPLKLWVYTFCYNEEKILPYVIEYWKQYATKVIVYDNGSTDNSLKILSQYSWIEVREFDTENTFDPEKISQYKSFCYVDAVGKADYVMVCDIDEVLLPSENLFPELVLAKKDNVQLFQTKYYEIINNELSPKYDSLIHTIEGYYAYPNTNIHKAIIFDPQIKIAFGPNSLTYSTNRNYITKSIITLHLKMISSNILVSRQKNLYLRLNKNVNINQDDALYYGNIKNIGTRISYFKLLFPYKYRFNKNENYITIFDDIYTMIKNSIKFKDLTWLPTKINHNSKSSNKECIFGIPIYKSDLTTIEKASLTQLCKIIQNKFEICLICPEDLNLREYVDIAEKYDVKLSTLFCAKQYFTGTASYSYMCETADFYKCFSEYKYLFIYQLDGWIFEDNVQKYLDLDVDYIGSPWNVGSFNLQCDTIGNGGVSLRKVQKFIDVCNSFTPEDYEKDWVKTEDLFFCKTMKAKANLKLPTVQVGSNFSLCGLWGRFMTKYNDGKLPMCLHGWHRDYLSYWKRYINLDEFETTGDIKIVQQPIQSVQKSDYKTRLELIKMRLNNSNKPINIQSPAKIENTKIENKKEITQNTTMSSAYTDFYKDYYGIKNSMKWETSKQPTAQQSAKLVEPDKQEEKKEEVKQEIQNNLNYFNNSTLQYICDGLTENDISLYPFERIIVTLTSWTKRIKNVHHVIQTILTNTRQPDIINVNLAIEEFPNKEKDLPKELIQDLKNNSKIKITWLKHNTKVWKKLIPTLYKYPNDIIIPIDDDFTYPNNFIDTIYNEYLKYNKDFPISANRAYFFGMQCHCGCASLTKKEFIEPYFYILNNTIMTAGSDDIFYSFCAKKNNKEYKRSQIQFSMNMPAYQTNNAYSTGSGASCDITKTYRECEKSFNNTKNPLSKNDILNLLKTANYKSLDTPTNASKQKIYLNTITENSKSFFDELRKNAFIYDLNSKLYNKEKAIISLTSWKERINYVGLTLYNLLSTCPDFHVVLVLSIDEFPKKEYELPENIKLLLNFKLIEILWVQKNYKAFKKVLFTMDKYREVPIISADDDCIYLYNYAEKFYQEWLKDRDCFISSWGYKINNVLHTAGCATLYPPYIFKDVAIKCLTNEITEKTNQDDDYYTEIKIFLNLTEGKIIGNAKETYIFHDSKMPLSRELKTLDKIELHKFLSDNINKTYNKNNDGRIIVSMTSYPKRIENVSKSIKLLLEKQTRTPDEIHLWLSEQEFPKNEQSLPEDLLKVKKQYNKVFIHWLQENTFVHKRHEIFKITNDNDYVFLIDDDVEYNSNLIKTVMELSQKYQDTIILYNTYSEHLYNGKRIIYKDYKNISSPTINKFRWCGQSMIPSKIYPKEILLDENQKIRNNTSPISDECWFQPWVVYNDIPIYACSFGWGIDIDPKNGKNTGLISWTHQKDTNGLEKRDNWLNAVLNAYPKIYKKYKKLFNYDV